MTSLDALLARAEELSGSLVADRRAIHHRPELAYHEFETSALVQERLRELGVPFRAGVGGTGVVGLISGTGPGSGSGEGRCVLLRADMDALPILEESDAPWASSVRGVMHACGHDAHTAVLIGAARLLMERRSSFAGSVKLMFQPAEEGGAGALKMIDEGLLEDPHVDAAFMLHVGHALAAGHVATAGGPVLAGADSFTITVEGRGGHASRPHNSVDPVLVASHVVVALQALVSREAPPSEPAVLTLASISGGTTHNVIPDRAVIRGTIRAYSTELFELLERRLREVAEGVAGAFRARATVDFEMRYPPTVNDDAMAELLAGAARSVLGAEAVEHFEPAMAAEDFSFVLTRVPGAMLSLGVRAPDWPEIRPVHTARFDLDESALPVGAACMAAVALEFLEG